MTHPADEHYYNYCAARRWAEGGATIDMDDDLSHAFGAWYSDAIREDPTQDDIGLSTMFAAWRRETDR